MSDNGKITWETETWRLGDLIPWEDNPRQLTEEQAERLERSLTKFGYSQLVEVEPDGTIVDGHQRDDLMKILPEFGPEAPIECRVSSRKLTLEERKEFIALKHQGATGEWNWEGMHNLYDFDELVDYGFDTDQLEAYGFLPDEEELLDDPGAQIDRAEELRELWGVQSGQLWRLGEHRLICGDCTDAGVVVSDGEPYNMILTDPPYGVEYSGQKPTMYYGKDNKGKAREEIINDDINPGDVISKMLDFAHAPILFIWHAPQMQPIIKSVVEARAFNIFALIVWNKNHANFGAMGARYKPKFEMATLAVIDKIPWYGPDNETTVWDIDRAAINEFHPTQKPVELFERAIQNHTDQGQVIYDPFVGSGTAIIACERLGCKCRAVEISPAYCAVAIQRWVDMTAGEPELIDA